MRTLLLPLLLIEVLSVCTAQVDENEFLLGKQRGLEAPNFAWSMVIWRLAAKRGSLAVLETRTPAERALMATSTTTCMLFEEPEAWYQAKKHYERLGGCLASTTSDNEQQFLTNRFQFADTNLWQDWLGPWIGYTDAGGTRKGAWRRPFPRRCWRRRPRRRIISCSNVRRGMATSE